MDLSPTYFQHLTVGMFNISSDFLEVLGAQVGERI